MKKATTILILIMTLLIIPFGCISVYADEQDRPENLSVAEEDGQPVIGYSAGKGYYVKLTWESPSSWGGDEQYYELHYRAENDNVFQLYGTAIERNINEIEMTNLNPGTVYYAHIHASHEHSSLDGGQPVSKDESQSEEIRFMTDLSISVEPGEDGTLEIKWNNVQYNSASVSYDVYISESASFAETSPFHVTSEEIGTGKAVQIEGDKLAYNASDLKTGTVYYVKIITTIDDDAVTCLPSSVPESGYTNITTDINRISSEWWVLEWEALTNTDLSENEGVLYKIYRCVDGDLEKEIAATKDTSIQVKVTDDNTYFIIKVDIVSQIGNTLSVGSEKIYAKESEIISAPPIPVVLENSSEQHTEIGSNNITLLWEAPYTLSDELDTAISYDIWLLDKAEDIDDDDITPDVKDFTPKLANYVYELIGSNNGTRIIGYKYDFTGLNPNTVYYLKMKAKKTYTIDEQQQILSSEATLKAFVTLTDGAIDQPTVPSVPPFKVKTQTVNGKTVEVTTKNSVTLQWENQWYEVWDDTDSNWEYLADEDVDDVAVTGEVYRLISYDPDILFSVGYEVYSEDFDYSRLLETTASMPMQFKNIPNSTTSTTVEFTATDLLPNTPYIMWMRAYRSDSLKSNLSDPIVVITRPDYETPLYKPSVPNFTSIYEGDTYADFKWDMLDGYYYIIKYGTEDDILKASKTITLSPSNLESLTKYTVESLLPNTDYYFWIQAKVVDDESNTEESNWSDSYNVETTAYTPPDVPVGFGIKSIDEPIGTKFIYFDWILVDGLEYTIQIAKKEDFSDAVSYAAGVVSEYKVEGLSPNTRYYARLYAYDSDKDVKSDYTSTVSAKTLKSNDEYDTGVDTETSAGEVPKPELDDDDIAVLDVEPEKTDMFIEEIFNTQSNEFIVDFAGLNPNESSKTKHPEGVEISKTRISPRILTALEQRKMNLILDNGPAVLILKSGIMQNQILKQQFNNNPDAIVEIVLEKKASSSYKSTGGTYVSQIWKTSVNLETTGGKIPFYSLSGFKIKIPYYDSKWFDKTTMSGCIYDSANLKWVSTETTSAFDTIYSEGAVYSIIPGSSDFAVMKISGGKFSDISGSSYATEIKAITDKYNLKCFGTGLFEPSKTVVKSETVKILLDILNYNYDEDYLAPAKKAGITTNISMADPTEAATKEEAAAMIVRVYELVTGNKATSDISLTKYYDGKTVDKNLSAKVAFAVENKIIDSSGGYIRPKDSFTRGQMMVMIKNMLEKAGVL